MKVTACEGCAEICCELGAYYAGIEDIDEAVVWYYNAAYETESILNVRCSGEIPLRGLAQCYPALSFHKVFCTDPPTRHRKSR